MRMFNNYSNSYESKIRINEIRGLSNEYGLNLDSRKDEYNEDNIIKSQCNFHKNKNAKNNQK